MQNYHTKKYFYTLIFKNHKVEVLHTSIASTQKNLEPAPYVLASCSFKLDKDFTIVDINDNLLNLLHYYNKEEFLKDCQHNWSNCIHKKDFKEVKETLTKNMSTSPTHQLEYRIRKMMGLIYGYMIKGNMFLIMKNTSLFNVLLLIFQLLKIVNLIQL